jgi:SAM-dependent methyltransferase
MLIVVADSVSYQRLEDLHEQERRAAREYAPLYDSAYETLFWQHERRAFVRRAAAFAHAQGVDLGSARALDVGTGTGSTLVHLREAGVRHLSGNDISRDMLDIATRKLPGVELTLGPVEDAAYEDSSFDLVLGFSVLHHLPDLRRFFEWLARVLTPGGAFAFSDPNAASVLFRMTPAKTLSVLLYPVTKPLRIKNRRELAGRPTMSDERYYSEAHRSLARDEIFAALPARLDARVRSRGILAPSLNAVLVDRPLDRLVLTVADALDRLLPLEGAEIQVLGCRVTGDA